MAPSHYQSRIDCYNLQLSFSGMDEENARGRSLKAQYDLHEVLKTLAIDYFETNAVKYFKKKVV